MSSTLYQSDLFLWVIGLVIGLPIIIVILGEWIEHLEAQQSPLLKGVRYVRHVTIPLLAVLILLYQIIHYTGSANLIRILETVFWFTVIYSTLMILGSVIQIAEDKPESLLARIPSIFFVSSRAAILGFIIYYVTSTVWGIDISNLSAALGVGALAISLALQDTISNLVSGLLLIADRPFQIGDWIHYDDKDFIVEEVSWRATRLRSRRNTMTIIPNGVLGREAIENLGRPGSSYHVIMSIDYSDDYPPNYISGVLSELLAGIDGIKDHPSKPFIRVNRYDDSVIVYDMEFWIDFVDYLHIPSEVKNKLYYIAKRHNLPRPSPVRIINLNQESEIDPVLPLVQADMLQKLPLYNTLDMASCHRLASDSMIHNYGKGEYIFRYGQPDNNLYIIQAGGAFLFVADQTGREQLFMQLSKGDIFGEMTLLNEGNSPISALASEDTEVVQMPHESVSRLLTTQPKFSTVFNAFIEDRQRRLRSLIDVSDEIEDPAHEDSWLNSIGGLS